MTKPKPRPAKPVEQKLYVDLLGELDSEFATIAEADLPELKARVQSIAACCEAADKLTRELYRRLKQAGLLEV